MAWVLIKGELSLVFRVLSCLYLLTWEISRHWLSECVGSSFPKPISHTQRRLGKVLTRQRMVDKWKTGDGVRSQISPGDTQVWLEIRNSRRQVINRYRRKKETISLNSVQDHTKGKGPWVSWDSRSLRYAHDWVKKPLLCREDVVQVSREPPNVLIGTLGAKLLSDKVVCWQQGRSHTCGIVAYGMHQEKEKLWFWGRVTLGEIYMKQYFKLKQSRAVCKG